jgi:hypothetical protein
MGISARFPMRTVARLAEFVPLATELGGENVSHECGAIVAAWALDYFGRLRAQEPHLLNVTQVAFNFYYHFLVLILRWASYRP